MSVKTVSTDLPQRAGRAASRSAASRPAGLPLARDLAPAYALSSVIAFLVALAAAAGLLFRATVYPVEEVMLAFAPVDAFHLAAGLPILLGSMWLTRRGHLAGLLCWPGAFLYVLYSYVTNLVGVPFGPLFLPYLFLVILSAYALIVLVASIDGEAVRRRLDGAVPSRAAGGILAVLTGLFILNAVVEIVTALATRAPAGPLDLMLWIADLATLSPPCLVGGILLWRRRALGYVGGTGLLLAYSMLFLGLVPVLVFPALYDAAPIDLAGLVMMLTAALICLVPFALFVRAATSDRGAPSTLEEGAGQ